MSLGTKGFALVQAGPEPTIPFDEGVGEAHNDAWIIRITPDIAGTIPVTDGLNLDSAYGYPLDGSGAIAITARYLVSDTEVEYRTNLLPTWNIP